MEDTTMGNQQQNMNFEIGYILGMLDGEGCVTIVKSGKTKTPPLYTKLQPLISITNTNQDIIDRCVEYLGHTGLPFHVSISHKALKYKSVTNIRVTGLKRCLRWIEYFRDYNFGKKNKFELLEKFILSRMDTIEEHPSRKPYSENEIGLFNQVRLSNGMGGKSRSLFIINPLDSTVKEKRYKFEKMVELLDKGWSQEKIASFFGVDQSSISGWVSRNKGFMDAQRLPSGLLK